MKDPNPKVSGAGISALEEYGIRVNVGILQKECEWLNRGYIKWITINKPWVIAKVVLGLTGLRVSEEEEIDGLDISAHGERGYDLS